MDVIDDGSAKLTLRTLESGEIELSLDTSYVLLFLFKRLHFSLRFTPQAFQAFAQALDRGEASKHGLVSPSHSKLIFIHAQNHPNRYRNVSLYHRFLFVFCFRTPTSLSAQLVDGLVSHPLSQGDAPQPHAEAQLSH